MRYLEVFANPFWLAFNWKFSLKFFSGVFILKVLLKSFLVCFIWKFALTSVLVYVVWNTGFNYFWCALFGSYFQSTSVCFNSLSIVPIPHPLAGRRVWYTSNIFLGFLANNVM